MTMLSFWAVIRMCKSFYGSEIHPWIRKPELTGMDGGNRFLLEFERA